MKHKHILIIGRTSNGENAYLPLTVHTTMSLGENQETYYLVADNEKQLKQAMEEA